MRIFGGVGIIPLILLIIIIKVEVASAVQLNSKPLNSTSVNVV